MLHVWVFFEVAGLCDFFFEQARSTNKQLATGSRPVVFQQDKDVQRSSFFLNLDRMFYLLKQRPQ